VYRETGYQVTGHPITGWQDPFMRADGTGKIISTKSDADVLRARKNVHGRRAAAPLLPACGYGDGVYGMASRHVNNHDVPKSQVTGNGFSRSKNPALQILFLYDITHPMRSVLRYRYPSQSTAGATGADIMIAVLMNLSGFL
jgi:hypothetical protein